MIESKRETERTFHDDNVNLKVEDELPTRFLQMSFNETIDLPQFYEQY